MTISEIKNLTKFLTDEEVDKIKEEIKSKEDILKSEDMEEEEQTQVLNTLFAILVIEKTLESEIEGVEDIRAELEQELLESYEIYDAHMVRVKNKEKKKKKRWLLDFLFLSDRIHTQKEGLGTSDKVLKSMKRELDTLKQQKSNENLKEVMKNRGGPLFEDFCKIPHESHNPLHHHKDTFLHDIMGDRRRENFVRDVVNGRINRENTPKIPREVLAQIDGQRPRVSVTPTALNISDGKQDQREQPTKNSSRKM